MGTLCAGKGCRLDSQARRSGRPDLDLDATLRAGAGYRRVGGLDDSSPARGAARPQRQADGAGRSSGAACAFRSPAIGTARAEGRGGNCECWRHTPRAGFHQFLCGVRAESASGQPGTEASHRAGEQSPGRKSGLLSEAGSGGRWTIPRRRSGGGRTSGCLRASRWESRSKLGGAHRHRLQLVPQFESDIPDPLADDLPGELSPGRVAAPAVGVLLAVFIS